MVENGCLESFFEDVDTTFAPGDELPDETEALRDCAHACIAISGSLDAKIKFSGAASNIALTSPSSWKEFNSSKVASDDGLSIEL